MKQRVATGFTIIEVVLFLAITSLMIVGVIVSSGSSVNQQRYKDTVYSLESNLQGQYSETLNTRNTISTNLTCGSDASVTFDGSSKRGQTDCVLLGRYVTVSGDGKNIEVYPVVGYQNSVPLDSSDLAVFQSYAMKTLATHSETYALEWGATMQSAGPPVATASFTLLILRSPASGVIRTFVSQSNNASITNAALVNSDSLARNLLICIDSGDMLSGKNRMGVKVNAGASTSNGVETVGDAISVADGGCS